MAMENKESVRRPTSEELLLIKYLAQKGQYTLKPDWQQAVWAEPITEERNGDEHVSCGNSKMYEAYPIWFAHNLFG